MNLKNTKTEQNLLAAFAGESMAANKYDFFAARAKTEGYEQIAAIFTETAHNERAHAKLIFQFLNGIQNTPDNLIAAAAGEGEEWVKLYPQMAQDAHAEGLPELAAFFHNLAAVEKEHQSRFAALELLLKENKVFADTAQTVWICRHCGHIHVGEQPPENCPLCKHPKAYFERKANNY